MKTLNKIVSILGIGTALTASTAMAASFTYNDGDLILGFQASGGTGSGKNVFFNLGSAVALRNGTSMGIKGNINSTLESAYVARDEPALCILARTRLLHH
jgi:hypothetical protein